MNNFIFQFYKSPFLATELFFYEHLNIIKNIIKLINYLIINFLSAANTKSINLKEFYYEIHHQQIPNC
jgi:hypothetical protein